jgi:hypothetical protein
MDATVYAGFFVDGSNTLNSVTFSNIQGLDLPPTHPVPKPAVLSLLGLALVGVSARSRKWGSSSTKT